MKRYSSLSSTIKTLHKNQRACVMTEPLWAIPYNMFLPFLSVYMAAIGLSDKQIGMLASLGLFLQLLWGLFSGAIVDKYGRTRMMLVFGLLSWGVPCLLWANAHHYVYFLLAVFFNSMWQVTGNSFSCMIVEDGNRSNLVNIYAIFNIIGIIAGFLSPVIGLFIDHYTLVPVMRCIYGASMLLMVVKFVLQYRMAEESAIGLRRRSDCGRISIVKLTFRGFGTFAAALQESKLLLSILLAAFLNCFSVIQASFWPLFVTKACGISPAALSIFPFLASGISLAVYLLISPGIKVSAIKRPILAGMVFHALNPLLLMSSTFVHSNGGKMGFVILSACCEALAVAMISPLLETVMSIVIPGKDRASINSFIFGVIFLIGTPVGWIAGSLSQRNRSLPMMLNFCFILISSVIALALFRRLKLQEIRN